MKDWKSLSHVLWECKQYIVFVSKYRHKRIYGKIREKIGDIIRDLCKQKGIELLEGHAMPDHIHLCLSIPPKFSVSNTVGFIKGKSAIRIHRQILGTKRMTGLSFWATGYCVSTVGLDEEMIRKYIRDQNAPDSQYDALNTNNNQPLQGLSLGQCPLREGFIKPRPTRLCRNYFLVIASDRRERGNLYDLNAL